MAEVRRNGCQLYQEQLLSTRPDGTSKYSTVLDETSACPVCHDDGQRPVTVAQHPHQPPASSPAAAVVVCEAGCSCKLTRTELQESKENDGYGLGLDDVCPAMACQHPVSSHQKQLGGERKRRSGGESSEATEGGTVSATNEDVSAFWCELPHAVLTPLPLGQLLKLPNDAPILGLRDLGSSLYLRDVYDRAYQKIKSKLAGAHRKGILVLGTPGSGKSVLACVLMLRILQDHPAASIVYFDNKRAVDKYICFAPGSEPRVANKLGAFRAELQQASTILIFDEGGPHCPPVPATGFNAQHIVLSSANPEHYSEWAKNHPLRLVLPTWSLEEIKQAYAHIYTDAKFADYEARFRTLGGVPRYVFAPDATFIEIRDRFKQEIPNADDIARLLMTIDQTAITVQKGARLLTYEVDAELQVVRTRWVSDQIGQWSMERLALSDEKRMMDLLCVMAENPSLGGQFGLSFEPWAHLTLAKGGTFHIRELGKADTGATLQLIKSGTTTYFDDFNMVQDKTYGRPHSKVAESIDAVYQPDLIFQMTVSTSKDVNLAGLNVCLAGLRDKASQTLLLAVPETVYHKFTTVRLQPAMSVWPPTIKRYVLSIPIRAPASGSKRKASDLLVGVKTRVTKDAAFDDAMVDELVIGRTDAELAALAQDGVESMKKKHKTWMRVGSYPTAGPQLDVYKRAGNGSFIYVPR